MDAPNTHRPARPLIVGGIVFLCATALAALLVWQLERQALNEERARVANLAGDHAHSIESSIDHTLTVTHVLAAMVRQGNGRIAEFDAIAAKILPVFPNVSELALAPKGVIRNVAPLLKNELALGLDLFATPAQRKESLRARDTGMLTLAGPLELVQGGAGVIGRLPVFLEDNSGRSYFWGFTLAMMRLPGGLDFTHLSSLEERGLGYQLWRVQPDTGQKQIITQSNLPGALLKPEEYKLRLPNVTWTLSVAPVRGWGSPSALFAEMGLGLLFSLLLGYLAKYFVELRVYRQQLEARVSQRTRDIQVVQRSLQATLDAIPDLVWLKDADGVYLNCNPMFGRFIGTSKTSIVGKTDYDIVDSELADFFTENDRKAMAAGKPSINEEWLTFADDGSRRLFETIKTPMIDEAGELTGVLGIARDITERKRYIDELEHKALYDNLTDLPNRALFTDRLKLALAAARRETKSLAIILLDVSRLKEVNEILGHDNGDIVLQEVASRLSTTLRKTDTVARLGGDEFAILLPVADKVSLDRAITKILTAMQLPTLIEGISIDIQVSMGVAMYPEHGEDPHLLLSRADVALRVAKNEISGFFIYESGRDLHKRRRLSLLGELRQAIDQNELVLYYQPQINIASGEIMGVEALLRWPRTTEELVSPAEFVPLAEQTGLIRPLTLWVLEQAVAQCRRWRTNGLNLQVSVNLSARNLLDTTLPDTLATILADQQVPADCLMLEVTESAVMLHADRSLQTLKQLDEMGASLSIDDFGTGYSSLSYLMRLPVSELKIDQSFVFGMAKNESESIIVRSTIDLAHNLGLKVVAEGIEDQETLQLLTTLGCDIGQGYLFARPMSPENFGQWLSESNWGLPLKV